MNDALASEVHKALAEFARSTTRNARTTMAFAKKLDRKYLGSELLKSYYTQATKNLKNIGDLI